ncbi:MAG: hypothetical protein ACKPKO_19260 [Candidatus Fonsibacter sp.]
MNVNTNGHTVYAHEILSLNEITDIIQHSEDLMSKFAFLSPAVIVDTEFLLTHLQAGNTLVRTRGRDANKKYAWAHTSVVCECGCKLNRGLLFTIIDRQRSMLD